MDFSEHLALSALGSGALFVATGDAAAAAAFSATGVFIDLDHLADYWRETGLNADLKRFLGYFDTRQPRHLWLILHGWEWPLAALLAGLVAGLPAWAWAGAAGWFGHLVLDQRFNDLNPKAYWFFYRARLGFRSGPLFDWKA